jgi:hypothetical protein
MNFETLTQFAGAVERSRLFGLTENQCLALMIVAQAEGRHPGIVARDYHVINGKTALKADAMLARFQEAGGRVEWLEMTETSVTGTFSHPAGGSLTITWTLEMASKAGLLSNPTWKKYPRAMLRSRCVSEAIRSVYPAVICGTYTPEEVESFTPSEVQPRQAYRVQDSLPQPEIRTSDVQILIEKMSASETLDALKEDFQVAHRAAKQLGDHDLLMEVLHQKDVNKARLVAEVAVQDAVVGEETL